jgi:hypothetical protein
MPSFLHRLKSTFSLQMLGKLSGQACLRYSSSWSLFSSGQSSRASVCFLLETSSSPRAEQSRCFSPTSRALPPCLDAARKQTNCIYSSAVCEYMITLFYQAMLSDTLSCPPSALLPALEGKTKELCWTLGAPWESIAYLQPPELSGTQSRL